MSARPEPEPAALGSPAFLRAYLVTMRPYLLFVSGITGLAGLALAPAVSLPATLLLGLVFFLSYGFGQALTDCFQVDTDAISSPYRPLVRGAVRRRDVMVVSLAGLLASGVILAAFHLLNLPLALAAIVGLATYTPFKRRWWGGPFYNAWIVGVLFLIGWVSGHGPAGVPLAWRSDTGWALAAVFFGYADFVLTGYFKDVTADRATGYRTFPVVFGLRAAAWASDLLALAMVVSVGGALAGVPWSGRPWIGQAAVAIFAAAGVAALLVAHLRLHRVRGDAGAHRAIAPVVHAYILLLTAVAAANRPGWLPGLVLFYLGFLGTLRARPMKEQI